VCVAEISRNPAIIFVCRALIKVLFQTIQPYPLDAEENTRIIAHHKGIYKAIRNGKREKAEELMKEHVQEMKQLFSEYEKAEKQST